MASKDLKTDFKIDHYSLLGVERNASKQSILKAFRQRARLFHPDKNPGNEELMKQLNTAKITLIDPEKRAYYDDSYTPESDDIPEGEKVFLQMGKRLSESFIEKIKYWKKEFENLEIHDNIEVIGKKWLELRDTLVEISREVSHNKYKNTSMSRYHELLNTRKTNKSLQNTLANLMPGHIWRMDGVNSNRVFLKKIFIQTFGNWKISGDQYFDKQHYKTALFCYQTSSQTHEVILKKARYLYEEKNYEISLLYYRYLFDFDEYKSISTLMFLKILAILKQDIFDVALQAAHQFEGDVKIHKFLLKLLIERGMIFEAKDVMDIVMQLGNENVTKDPDLIKQCEQKNYDELQALVYAFELEKMAEYMKKYRCSSVIDRLYMELTKGQIISQLLPKYRATLSILKGTYLQIQNKYNESLDCFREALFLFPMQATATAVSTLLSDCYIKPCISQFLDQIKLSKVQFPTSHEYQGMLRGSPLLRTVIKYEKSVLNQKISDFEKAMLYIDLTVACGHPSLVANNFLIAAYFLVKGIESEDDLATKYAYRNTICELCASVFFFTNRYMDPVTSTHFVKLSLSLMNSSHEVFRVSLGKNKKYKGKKIIDLLNPSQVDLINIANRLLSNSIKVNPLMDIPTTLSGDLLFMNLVVTEFLENFYNFMTENKPSHTWNHLYLYYLHEGSWKNWADKKEFNKYRENCMNNLLERKGWNSSQVENVMSWNAINRDSNGWIDTNKLDLNLPGDSFTSVEGVVINIENGTFELILSMNPDEPDLFNANDIQEILCKGITHSVFTLEQPDPELNVHPFQEMKYGPDSLKNTNYLATLLHADYLLKMFTMETEVSAKKPFRFREGEGGFLQVLPVSLREVLFSSKYRENISPNGQVHRFWIENKDLPYTQSNVKNDELRFTFGYCPMIVKKHLMKYDSNGKLMDDEDSEDEDLSEKEEKNNDDEGSEGKELIEYEKNNKNEKDQEKFYKTNDKGRSNASPEKMFAKNFSLFYEEIGFYFPIFLRLRELLKLGAILHILRSIHMNLEIAIKSIESEPEPIRMALKELKRHIEYPLNTTSRRDDIFTEILRDNGIYNENRVDPSEIMRVKSDIYKKLEESEEKLLYSVATGLGESLDLTYCTSLQQYVSKWIVNGNETALVSYLADKVKERRIEKMSRFCLNLNHLGINLKENNMDLSNSVNECNWVPAAFSEGGTCKTYGGVCLVPKLVCSSQSGGQGGGGRSGSGGGGMGGGKGGNDSGIKDLIKKQISKLEDMKLATLDRYKGTHYGGYTKNMPPEMGMGRSKSVEENGKMHSTLYVRDKNGNPKAVYSGYKNRNLKAQSLECYAYPDHPTIDHVTTHPNKYTITFKDSSRVSLPPNKKILQEARKVINKIK